MHNQLKPGYKNSPLGPIPEEWEIEELGNIFEYVNTPSFSREALTNDETINKIYYIHYGDIHSTYRSELLDFNKQLGVPYLKDDFYNPNFNFLKEGDLVIADASEDYKGIGESIEIKNIEDKKVIGGLHTLVIRDKYSKTINGFRAYIFRNVKVHNEITRIATGTSVYSIGKGNLSKIRIPLPSLPEQQAIANILKTIDDSINLTREIIKKLEIRNKGLQQKLLTGKVRLKGFSEMDLQFLAIKSFAKEISEKNKDNKDLVVLSCTKYDGLVPSLEYFGRRIYSDDLTTYKVVCKNCFAYATNHIEEGSIGYQDKYDRALISPMYTVFKTNETIHDEYLFRLLKTHHSIHEYQKRMEGSIDRRGGLRWDEFSKIKVPVPSMEEQKAITNILDKATEELSLYKQKLEKLKQTKKGFMQQLLTGKVRVKLEK